MTKEDLKRWASHSFYRSFRRNKERALLKAERYAVDLEMIERVCLASTFDAVAKRAIQMSGWFGGGKSWLWLISAGVSFLLLSEVGGLWYSAPLIIMFLIAYRDRWACRSRAEAYIALASVLDTRHQEPRAPSTGHNPAFVVAD